MEDINCWEEKFELCQYSDQLLNIISELNKRIKIPVNVKTIKKACYYARMYHGEQTRKSKEPYYSHPLMVAYLFASYVGKDIPQYYTTYLIVIAILHDCLEDTKFTYEMIVKIFGERVAIGVQDLTRLKHVIKTTAADTLNSLFLQCKFDILHVKVFDRLHNLQSISFMPLEKQKKIIEETISHFIPMTSYLNLYDITQELVRLCKKNFPTQSPHSFEDNSALSLLSVFPNLQNEIDRIRNR